MFKIFVLFLVSINCFAQQGTGLYRLNPLPQKDWVSRSFFKYERADVNVDQSQSSTTEIQEKHYIVEQEIGRRIAPLTFLSVVFNYGKSELSDLRDGIVSKDTYSVVGFQEPAIKLYSRRKFAEGVNQPILDISLLYAPSFSKGETGSSGGNRLLGRDKFMFLAEYGKFYEYWDFKISGGVTYYSDGKTKNLEINKTSDSKSYTETEFLFSFQHTLSETYFVRGGIGLRIVADQDIVQADSTSTVQNGTGSHHFIGLVRHNHDYTTILKLERYRNDYFVQSDSQSYQGDYVFRSISLEVLWDI